jgi:hypothetical protein
MVSFDIPFDQISQSQKSTFIETFQSISIYGNRIFDYFPSILMSFTNPTGLLPDPDWQSMKQRFEKLESFRNRIEVIKGKQKSLVNPADTIAKHDAPVATDDMTTYATLSKEIHMMDDAWSDLIQETTSLQDDIKHHVSNLNDSIPSLD